MIKKKNDNSLGDITAGDISFVTLVSYGENELFFKKCINIYPVGPTNYTHRCN